ncbi:hypothetical protein ACEPAI_2191 [Sanghuangporus weigelae]
MDTCSNDVPSAIGVCPHTLRCRQCWDMVSAVRGSHTLGRLKKTPLWLAEIRTLFRPNESYDSMNVPPPISDVEEEQLRKFIENMELERLFGLARDPEEELDSLLPDSDDE